MSLVFAFVPGMAPEAGGAVFNTMNLIVLGAIAMITAWETQMLKRTYYSFSGNDLMLEKLSAYGAASLLSILCKYVPNTLKLIWSRLIIRIYKIN